MRLLNFISVVLHPIVLPTVVVLCFFFSVPIIYPKSQRLTILALVFITTYLIPILFVFLFRRLGVLTSYDKISLNERKLPVLTMLFVFYLMGKAFYTVPNLRDLGTLFYSSASALCFIYIVSFLNVKASLHLVAMGIATGFFLHLNSYYSKSFLGLIIVFILLSGFLASSLLYLRSQHPKEIYVGFFIGLLAPLLFSSFLQ
ncbi:MAG: hypothetical protein CMB99_11065 [Flavobacteriaceae bacterium]|nr:hypothetical protein [Flavobacteriaceae bacterium]|tara:strand:+ start:113416 stop:114018 length:603 start_codon:yes stop_codon:yes gene_type:complete